MTMRRLINKDNVTAVVHGGCFHADNVACIALLKLVHNKVNIVRKFKVDIESEEADYVLDIGRVDKVSDTQVFLDHHQGPEIIDSTQVKHCAFSKLVEHMMDPDDAMFNKYFMNTLVLPIAAQDNGQNYSDFGLLPSPLTFVNAMGLSWKDDQNLTDQRFAEVVDMAMVIIENIIKNAKDKVEAVTEVLEAVNNEEDGIVVLNRYLPWTDTVIEYNNGEPKVKLIIYPSNRGGFNVQVVPKKACSFDSWISIPESITEVKGCTGQAHGAFAFFDNLNDAVAAAKNLVNA